MKDNVPLECNTTQVLAVKGTVSQQVLNIDRTTHADEIPSQYNRSYVTICNKFYSKNSFQKQYAGNSGQIHTPECDRYVGSTSTRNEKRQKRLFLVEIRSVVQSARGPF